MQEKPTEAFLVTVIREPAREITVADVIVGSLGIAGALLLLALVLGVLAGAALVLWHRWRPVGGDHLPPVKPSFTDADFPPSARVP